MIEQSEHRQLQGYSLTLILTSQKLIIRAIEEKTCDLYICQYRRGHLPHDVQLLYETEEQFFDVLLTEQGVRVEGLDLKVPFAPRVKRPVRRELSLGLTKVELNEIEDLKRKVALLQRNSEEINQMKSCIKQQAKMLENIEKRTFIYYYDPGVFRSLVLNAQNDERYKIFGNTLIRKPQKMKESQYGAPLKDVNTYQEHLKKSLVSSEPICQDSSHYSFKITINDISTEKDTKAFIGICTKFLGKKKDHYGRDIEGDCQHLKLIAADFSNQYEVFNNIPTNKNYATQITQKGFITVYRNNCESFYKSWGIKLKKGDTLTLTVNNVQKHLTWYRNQVSIERSYIDHYTQLYPFVYLEENVEAIIF